MYLGITDISYLNGRYKYFLPECNVLYASIVLQEQNSV